jgi:hypothetical protein
MTIVSSAIFRRLGVALGGIARLPPAGEHAIAIGFAAVVKPVARFAADRTAGAAETKSKAWRLAAVNLIAKVLAAVAVRARPRSLNAGDLT